MSTSILDKSYPTSEEFCRILDQYSEARKQGDKKRPEVPNYVYWQNNLISVEQLMFQIRAPYKALLGALLLFRDQGPVLPPVMRQVSYVLDGYRIYRGVDVGSFYEGTVLQGNQTQYFQVTEKKGNMTRENMEELAELLQQTVIVAVYAGNRWFKKIPTCKMRTCGRCGRCKGGDVKIVEDRKFVFVPGYYEKGMDQEFSYLYPISKSHLSFTEEEVYQTEGYSLWAEQEHGPIANEIIKNIDLPVTCPADGHGLFASRPCKEGSVFGDINVAEWTHDQVKKETIRQTLKRGKEGSVQIFSYCTSFMTDEDWELVRPPYIFIDRYPPKIHYVRISHSVFASSSYPLHSESEVIDIKNVPFSNNLLLRAPVAFTSSHEASEYMRDLLQPEGGKPVSQTWKDYTAHPNRYFVLAGLVPATLRFSFYKRIYTRVVYEHDSPLPGASTYFTDAKWYNLYLVPGTYAEEHLYSVQPFPIENIDKYLGYTKGMLVSRFGEEITESLLEASQEQGYILREVLYDLTWLKKSIREILLCGGEIQLERDSRVVQELLVIPVPKGNGYILSPTFVPAHRRKNRLKVRLKWM